MYEQVDQSCSAVCGAQAAAKRMKGTNDNYSMTSTMGANERRENGSKEFLGAAMASSSFPDFEFECSGGGTSSACAKYHIFEWILTHLSLRCLHPFPIWRRRRRRWQRHRRNINKNGWRFSPICIVLSFAVVIIIHSRRPGAETHSESSMSLAHNNRFNVCCKGAEGTPAFNLIGVFQINGSTF